MPCACPDASSTVKRAVSRTSSHLRPSQSEHSTHCVISFSPLLCLEHSYCLSMGHKADQNLFPSTYRPNDQSAQSVDRLQLSHGVAPPPLPPRDDPNISLSDDAGPPPYSEVAPTYHSQPLSHSWSSQDPRSSSMQSLVPHSSSEGNGIRTLLLVYIHGFMGNETSFQSFPAHVHNLLTVKLKETHVVHSKIYPKYKSRKDVKFARDSFSEW